MLERGEQRAGRRPNYVYTVISVALVLFLLGFFGLLLLQANRLSQALREQVDLIVELHEDSEVADRERVMRALEQATYTKPGTVEFISREQALEQMSAELGEDVLRLDLPNPLYDVVTFNVQSDFLVPDSLANIRNDLRSLAGVSDVFYQENFVERIAANVSRIGWISLAVGVFFVLISMVMIHNTVRLALYANRFLIKTQELVGATWGFITRPYLRRAAVNGLISGLLAATTLVAVQIWLHLQAPELRLLDNPALLAALLVLLPVLGTLISWASTFYVVRKYLRLRVDELY